MILNHGGKKMWCIKKIDQEYQNRMMDILEVYERPYNPDYPVVCMDEKSKQLLKETRQSIPIRPGRIKRKDYEYKRNGTINIFVAVEPKGKRRTIQVTKHRKAPDFAKFVKKLVTKTYKTVKKIILVVDNLNTHNKESITKTFSPQEAELINQKIEWHYTPKHASWLDQAEIEIGVLSKQCLKRYIPTFQYMQHEISIWTKERNKKQVGINWQFTREKAIDKFQLDKASELKE